MISAQQVLLISVLLLFFTLLAYGIDVYRHVLVSRQIVAKSRAFSYTNPDAKNRILVIGDSTAVGTGAEDPSLSVAGRFNQDFPDAEIVNLAENGAKAHEVLAQLRRAEGTFDLTLIHSGANDILYLTPVSSVTKTTRTLLKEADEISDTVVFLTGGNLGLAPMFIWPMDWFYSYRTDKILKQLTRIAEEEGALFVDLYVDKDHPFVTEGLERFYAPDLLHLNGKGYGEWYKRIRDTMSRAGLEEL